MSSSKESKMDLMQAVLIAHKVLSEKRVINEISV